MDLFDRPVILVGGAPRSGTTLAHALLCTSARTNSYCPEIGFLQPVFNAYRIGLRNWSVHTGAFYPDAEGFADSMRAVVRLFLADIARALGEPEVLCLKDPALSPLFYWVHHLMGKQLRFVTVVRHPADIVRSRKEVVKKLGQDLSPDQVRAVAAEVNASYAHLDVEQMQDAVLALRYEDLGQPDALDALRNFTGFQDISSDRLWSDKVGFIDPSKRGAWHSPKYYGPISFESRLEPLEPDTRRIVEELCGPLMQRFGYESAASAIAAGRQGADLTTDDAELAAPSPLEA